MLFEELSVAAFLEQAQSFDALFDVRSPGEYEESHIPGSENLYALDNAQRAEIGTLHKRSAFEAKLLGASMVCENLSRHIPTLHPRFHPGHKIALYCAQGRQRSASVATVLGHIGFRIWRIEGGYKAYRRAVLDYFDQLPDFRFNVLDGPTGSGKSELIHALNRTVDLEGLAGHKGSVFGGHESRQPSTKAFENRLMARLRELGSDAPIWIESESRNIGRITMPASVYEMMKKGRRIWIDTPLKSRIERIVKEYGQMSRSAFDDAMRRIRAHMPRTVREAIETAFDAGDLDRCAELLLVEYYDRVYKKPDRVDKTVRFETLEGALSQLQEAV